jgi:hypothetical protein
MSKTMKATEIVTEWNLELELVEDWFEQAKKRLAENLMAGWRAIASHTERMTEYQAKMVAWKMARKLMTPTAQAPTIRAGLERVAEMARHEVRAIIRGSLMTRSTCPITNFCEGIEREAKLHAWDEIGRKAEHTLKKEIIEDVQPAAESAA